MITKKSLPMHNMYKKQLRKILRTAKIVTSLKLCHARCLVTNLSKPRACVIMNNHPDGAWCLNSRVTSTPDLPRPRVISQETPVFIPCHAIENKSNQNTENNLRIVRRALIVCATVFSVAWYKKVTQRSLVVYHGISHLALSYRCQFVNPLIWGS